jgi:hypothetical protein
MELRAIVGGQGENWQCFEIISFRMCGFTEKDFNANLAE